ncbi:MAG: acyltransferase [Pseudomonadota bacterium]
MNGQGTRGNLAGAIQAKDMAMQERVFGWDLLRGICALLVATYHLLYWTDLAKLHVFGSYGVYLFFVLSGASMAYTYTYAGRFESGGFRYGEFLFVRFWRLAPLYVLLMLAVLPAMGIWYGPTGRLLQVMFLNVSMLMGLYNPSGFALLTGGWSLGVEAVFYLLFPLVLWALKSWRSMLVFFLPCVMLQVWWISRTLGAADMPVSEQYLVYHNAPSFAAYFVGGCILGHLARSGIIRQVLPSAHGLLILLAGFALMLAVNPVQGTAELTGWRGWMLAPLCLAMVAVASMLRLAGHSRSITHHLGDATYGVYLIHPVLYFYVAPALGLDGLKTGSSGGRLLLVIAILLASFVLALISERLFEQPVRHWSKSLLAAWRGESFKKPVQSVDKT